MVNVQKCFVSLILRTLELMNTSSVEGTVPVARPILCCPPTGTASPINEIVVIKRHDVGPFQKNTSLQLKLLTCVYH